MAKISAKNAVIVVNGYVLSTFMTQYEAMSGVDPVEVTGFTEGAHNFIPGLFNAHLNLSALWDDAANSLNAALSALPSNKIVTLFPEGYALGNASLSLPYMQENFSPAGSPADAIQAGTIGFSSYGNNSGIESGWALAHGTITETTTGTGFVDPTDAAVTAACAGSLHVWTPTTDDTYVVKIQHSTALASGYADLITFTLDGTARDSERITVASGTVNKYRRVVATRTGTDAEDFGFTVSFWHS